MKTSVIMTTYNGQNYIESQLISIMNQTYSVDEVLISDDGSSDDTISIIKKFIKENKLSNWELNINTKNLGWQTNFYQTIKKSRGDIIFLCDQDDIWYNSKVDEMTTILENNNDILLLASNYLVIDKNGKNVKTKKDFSNELIKMTFDNKFYKTKFPGCVLAFDRGLIACMDDLFFSKYPHDQMLWNIATILEGAYLYDKPLINHRKHNASATSKKNIHKKRLQKVEAQVKVADNINKVIASKKNNFDSDKEIIINQYLEFSKNRKNFLNDFNLKDLKELLNLKQFYSRRRTVLGDIYFSLVLKFNKLKSRHNIL